MLWRRPVLLCSTALVSVLVAGCGNQYRPVVSAINPVGPALQPGKYAIAISNPSPSSPGLLTFVDFAGDTVLTTPQILSNPNYLAVAAGGGTGYVINSAGSFNEFGSSSPSTLISSDISQSTLSAGSLPVSISPITLAGSTASVFVPEPALSQVAALSSTGSLVQNIGVPNNPVYVVGVSGGRRAYVISEGDGTTAGSVSSVESTNLAVSSTQTVGVNPTYGVMTADGTRAFILNKGSGTVNVINVVNNGPDLAMPLIPSSLPGSGTLGLNPVWADFSPPTSELVVLNEGDGVHPGSLSIINIPLCSTASPSTNPNCDVNNPVDAAGFGTVVATVPVGVNPVMVSVLQDGTKAYVANQGVICATGATNCTNVEGSVSVVNLASGKVSATIPATSVASATSDTNTTPTEVYGHPATIAATTGTPTGKVYITSPDNKFMTVIETDTDVVDTHVNLQGLGVKVVVTAQ
jgi:DNA-binding beta-propeller fold protein YncE